MNPNHAAFREVVETEKGRILYSVLLDYKIRGDLLQDLARSAFTVEDREWLGKVIIQIDKDVWQRLQEYKNSST